MVEVKISKKGVSYDIKLYKKFTVVRGYSGAGKTAFLRAMVSKGKVYTKAITAGYTASVISDLDTLENAINSNKRYVFFIDDDDMVFSKEFSSLFARDKLNFYVIFNRFTSVNIDSLGRVPFSVDAVYNFVTDGHGHWLEPYYEMDTVFHHSYDVVVTEDSKTGYMFLQNYNSNVSSACGKDNIIDFFKTNVEVLRNKRIFLFVDLYSYGSKFDALFALARIKKLDITVFYEYGSFEQLLLSSNFYNKDYSINSISNNVVANFPSHEKLCEYEIMRISLDKPYAYNAVKSGGKSKLSSCYTENCCSLSQTSHNCDRGIAGDKRVELFRGTSFERLFQIIANSSLVKINYKPKRRD